MAESGIAVAEFYRLLMRKRTVLLLAVMLIVSACAGGEAATTTPASVTSTEPRSTTTTVAATTTTEAVATTTAADTTTTTQQIDVYWEGGQVVGPDRFEFAMGEQVSIWVLSDADEEIHVHGYDVSFNAKAGIPMEVSLTADVPGIFEVELEETHTLLFELEVTS